MMSDAKQQWFQKKGQKHPGDAWHASKTAWCGDESSKICHVPSTGHLTRNRDDAWERLKKKHLDDAWRAHLWWALSLVSHLCIMFFSSKNESRALATFFATSRQCCNFQKLLPVTLNCNDIVTCCEETLSLIRIAGCASLKCFSL